MINGAHVLLYSADPEADRAFLRDVLMFRWVDAGEGWLIFRLPPAEVAVHPLESEDDPPEGEHALLGAEFYLMCDDVEAVVQSLKSRQVRCSAISTAPWGKRTTIRLPSGGQIGLYQPTHPTAYDLDS
ncbi:MAG TPA: VOC family protein [Candidatus Polarisedimenticolia bacterium]|nr:VOC family protein [Candidatus Polarisedimenticolia bacterium]